MRNLLHFITRFSLVASLLAIVAFAFAGCPGSDGDDVSGRQITGNWSALGNTLYQGNGSEPEDLDPQVVTGVTESNILRSLFEGLVTHDPKTLDPEPGVAESWEVSEDMTTFTFNFREDAKWSNGDPVTAQDFVFSYKRMLTPSLGAEYAYMLHVIENAQAYNSGEITDFSQVGVKALDDLTLEFRLENPTPFFLEMLMHGSWNPVHPPTIKKFNAEGTIGTGWTRPASHVGNGPFLLDKWVQNDRVYVTPNPHYWDREQVKLDGIVFLPIDDPNTESRAFRNAQMHVTQSLPVTQISEYKGKSPYYFQNPYLGNYYYIFNVNEAPFDDVRVRKALNMAIDRKSLVENVVKGDRTPAYNLVPTYLDEYEATAFLEENVEEAKRLLAEAGYPGGRGFPKVTLLYNTNENHKIIAEVLQAMWKSNLGINLELVNQEWKVYLATRRQGNFEVARAGWIADYRDPRTFLVDLFTKDSGNNHSGWSNPRYEELLSKADQTANHEERMRLMAEAEEILVEEVPFIPIYFYTNVYLKTPSVKGWYANVLDKHPYKYVYLDYGSEGGEEPASAGASPEPQQ